MAVVVAVVLSLSLGAALARSSPLTLGIELAPQRVPDRRRSWSDAPRVREVSRIAGGLGAGLLAVSSPLLTVAALVAIGAWLVGRRSADVRRDRTRADLEAIDAMTMLDVCLSAGLGLRESFVEMDRLTGGPLWRAPASALALGVPFDEVMERLGRDRPALGRSADAMARAHRDGGSVRAIVRGHRDDLIARRRAELTERSQRLGVLVLLPLTICILPALVLAVVVPIAADGFTGLAFPY